VGRNRAPLHFKTEGVADTALSAPWFLPTSARFAGTWRIFSSPGDSKLTPDCLGFHWNGHSETFWTLTLELLDGNIAPLYFKTKRVAETVLRKSWFWPTSSRFAGTWGIYSISASSKLTADGLGLHWNAHSITFWTPTLELVDRNLAPLHFKTERVAEIALRAWWFWPFSDRFLGTWGIFSSSGDSKLTPDRLALHWNGHSKTFERSLSSLWAEI